MTPPPGYAAPPFVDGTPQSKPALTVCIVGAVAGGASAATRMRRLNENANIIMIERESVASLATCGMPYYIGGEIAQKDALLVTKAQTFNDWYNIDLRLQTEALAIDRTRKVIKIRDLKTNTESEQAYDKLILSPGVKPIMIDIPGLKTLTSPNAVCGLRSLDDMDRIKAKVSDPSCKEVVVIGGGFIGLEMAEALLHLGRGVHLVELQNQVMPPCDAEMTRPIEGALENHGCKLHLGTSIDSVAQRSDGRIDVSLKDGTKFIADTLIMSVGVTPDSFLARDAGLELNQRGGIIVNSHLQTNDPDIYAVGDAIEVVDWVTQVKVSIPLSGPANRQGRLAADHIAGRLSTYRGTQGTSICRVFDTTIAAVGASEKWLKRNNVPFLKAYVHGNSHASYFPGSQRMTMKILYAPVTGQILGSQIVGGLEGVDKRIDVIAMAMQMRGTVFELEEAELAYSPPYGSAKDPVNMLGFVAAGTLRGDQKLVHFEDVVFKRNPTQLILDVRTKSEWDTFHFDNTLHIPLHELRSRISEVPKNKDILCMCRVGLRGYMAQKILGFNGYRAFNLSGGLETYQKLWLRGLRFLR